MQLCGGACWPAAQPAGTPPPPPLPPPPSRRLPTGARCGSTGALVAIPSSPGGLATTPACCRTTGQCAWQPPPAQQPHSSALDARRSAARRYPHSFFPESASPMQAYPVPLPTQPPVAPPLHFFSTLPEAHWPSRRPRGPRRNSTQRNLPCPVPYASYQRCSSRTTPGTLTTCLKQCRYREARVCAAPVAHPHCGGAGDSAPPPAECHRCWWGTRRGCARAGKRSTSPPGGGRPPAEGPPPRRARRSTLLPAPAHSAWPVVLHPLWDQCHILSCPSSNPVIQLHHVNRQSGSESLAPAAAHGRRRTAPGGECPVPAAPCCGPSGHTGAASG